MQWTNRSLTGIAVALGVSAFVGDLVAQAPPVADDPARVLVGRLNLDSYKATIKELTRFGDRLQASVTATTASLACRVPPLVLQPLVENAVRHGISKISSAGRVEIEAMLEDGRLVVEVRDDGLGFRPETATAGVGLRNTRERLAQLYGSEGRLEIRGATGRGTTARIELPARNGG